MATSTDRATKDRNKIVITKILTPTHSSWSSGT